MSTKKTSGNRWATAVEGAADILLDTGKSNDVVPSAPQVKEQPQEVVALAHAIEKKTMNKPAIKRESPKQDISAIIKTPSTSTVIPEPLDKPAVQPESVEKAKPVVLPGTPESRGVDAALPQSFDLIQQALTKRGRKSAGGRQRTYYIDNDIADKITSLANELDKSESQLLREVLRAVFKMNEQ